MKPLVLLCLLSLLSGTALADGVSIYLFNEQGAAYGVLVRLQFCQQKKELMTDPSGMIRLSKEEIGDCPQVSVRTESSFYETVDTLLLTSQTEHRLYIKEKVQQIAEVKVKGFRRIATGDLSRQVFKVDPKSISVSTTGGQLLRMIPSVYETENGGYAIIGRTGNASILIDGVEAHKNEVAALNASEIDKIEVQGRDKGGNPVIHIIKKKVVNRRVNGRVKAGAGTEPSWSVFPHLNYQDPKLSATLMFSWLDNKQRTEQHTFQEQAGVEEEFSASTEDRMKQLSAISKLHWLPTKHFSTSLSTMHFGSGGKPDMHYHWNSQPEQVRLSKDWRQTHIFHSSSAFKKRNYYVLGKARYLYHMNRDEERNNASYYLRTTSKEWSAEATVGRDSLRIGSWFLFPTLAYRYVDRKVSTENSNYAYNAYLHKAYVVNRWVFSGKVALSTGLSWDRYKIKELQRSFTDWLPYASLNFSTGKQYWEVSYDKRVTRPLSQELNPSLYYISEVEKRQGNIALEPTATHSANVRFSTQWGSTYINLQAGYKHYRHIIDEILLSSSTIRTYENVGKADEVNYSLGVFKSFLKRTLTVNANLSMYHREYDFYDAFASSALSVANKGWGYSAMLNLSYVPTRAWYFNAYLLYNGRNISLDKRETKRPELYLTAEKSFLKGYPLTVGISVNNPFHIKTKFYYSLRSMERQSTLLHKNGNVSLSIAYRFGKSFRPRAGNALLRNNDNNIRQE